MLLKNYEKPVAEFVRFSLKDVLSSSAHSQQQQQTTTDPYQTPRIGI